MNIYFDPTFFKVILYLESNMFIDSSTFFPFKPIKYSYPQPE